jgi:hypothetical protein
MNWLLSASLIVIPSILVCLLILWIIRRWVSHHQLKTNHEVAGFILGIVGVLYSVILGFTVVNVQTKFNEVQKTVHTEAISIADLYREAGFFPEKSRIAIRNALRTYVNYVVSSEWMKQDKKNIHIEAHLILEQIWNSYYQMDLVDEKTKIWYQESISKIDNFMDSRLSRIFNSWTHMGAMMWTILILGGVITICFVFFFGLERFHAQMIMTALLTGYISFMLFLVYSIDNVYQGPEGIQPTAFEQIITLFDRWDSSTN